jgi:hypothetical protein
MFDRRSGNAVVLILAKSSGDTQIHNLDKYSDDFMTERKQLKMQSGRLFDEDGRVMMSRSEA